MVEIDGPTPKEDKPPKGIQRRESEVGNRFDSLIREG